MAEYDLSRLRILIVDDYVPIRTILRSVLREFKVSRVIEAGDGEKALDFLAKAGGIDLVITDFQMAPMDGLELTKAIRKGDARIDPYIPVILVSAYTEMHNIVAARDAGVNDFLAKPISANLVYARIRSVIEHPLPFVQADEFFGPDRRRHDRAFGGVDRRGATTMHAMTTTAARRKTETAEATPGDEARERRSGRGSRTPVFLAHL